jgi:hypothetical protein
MSGVPRADPDRFMPGFFRRWVLPLLLLGGLAFVAVAAGILQEFVGDEIPSAAADAGVALPFAEPNLYVSTRRAVVELREGETVIKRYNCGFGHGPTFGRLGKDARCTPVGEYRILAKEIRKDVIGRGSRFLRIDFPNLEDAGKALSIGLLTRDEYEQVRAASLAGDAPPIGPLGGPLGIQGNFFFWKSQQFTDGSIALANGAINEIYAYLPVGAPVVIGD